MGTSYRLFIGTLRDLAAPASRAEVARYFRPDPDAPSADNRFLGVKPGKVFPVAKGFVAMPLADLERLLESPYYEARLGAVSIMDFQARARRTSADQREGLFRLYLRRHDRINNWDLVDRAAPSVIGGYLFDKRRGVLEELAGAANPWKRRTAIVSTYFFIRHDQLDDTFRIAERLVADPHDLVQRAVGGWVREAGKRDSERLLMFLNAHAGRMPRPMLREAIKGLAPRIRASYLVSDAEYE